ADRLNILNATALFEPSEVSTAASATTSTGLSAVSSAVTKSTLSPAAQSRQTEALQPVAFTTRIGDDSYRIYVLPFRQAYRLRLAEGIVEKETDKTPDYLYVVGIQRVALADEIIHALWPFGLWVITLLMGLNLVGWPLISLAFGPAEESISP